MRHTSLLAGAVLALLVTGTAVAQSGEQAPAYKASAEIAVKGDVVGVRTHAGWMGWDGVYLDVRTQDETVQVHLAPASFLEMLDLAIAERDKVELKGCLAKVDGATVLLVREIRRDNVVINVRDPKGRPVW